MPSSTAGIRLWREVPETAVGPDRWAGKRRVVPANPGIDGRSLAPLLRDPKAEWPHAAITHLQRPQDFSVSTERLRYLHYTGGDEELYDITTAPHEWTNLAGQPEYASDIIRLRALEPKT